MDSEVESALPLMVMELSDFQKEHLKHCTHTKQCAAPLVCEGNVCRIPPSLLGRVEETTPKLNFTTGSGNHTIYLEVVSDDYTTQRGMMMRRAFHSDWGMLFIFPDEARHAFWMHNTYIPLDMVFIRADGTVSNTHENAEALNDIPRYPSKDKIKYVIELPAGSVAKYQINESSKFDISAFNTTK